MTHEPDIIREAEAVVAAAQANRRHFIRGNDAGRDSIVAWEALGWPSEQAYIDSFRTHPPLFGLANPSPLDTPRRWCNTRFTYDGTQSDPGDEHKERV